LPSISSRQTRPERSAKIDTAPLSPGSIICSQSSPFQSVEQPWVQRQDGRWLYRCPELHPVNARHWRGPFDSEQAALIDLQSKRRVPCLRAKQVEAKRRQGYLEIIRGRTLILHLDPLTGATILTPFELVADG